jgi:hypothetical protein
MVHATQLATVMAKGIGLSFPRLRFFRDSKTALSGDNHITLHMIVPSVGQNNSVTHEGELPIFFLAPNT